MISGAAGAKTEPVKLIVLDPTGAQEITHLMVAAPDNAPQ